MADFDGVCGGLSVVVAVGVMGGWGDEEGVEIAEETVDSHGFNYCNRLQL